MLEKWQLSNAPFEKDNNRWLLKLKITDNELDDFIKQFGATLGRPFSSNTTEFNWGVYLYSVTESEKEDMVKILKSKCSNGEVSLRPSKPEIVMPELPFKKEKPKENKAAVEPDAGEDSNLNPRYTFEEFIIGPNNRFTQAAAMAVAENPGKVYNPLFIHGGVGLGKTHLMVGIGHYVRKKYPHLKIMYLTSEKFINDVINSLAKGTLQEFRDRYRKVDLLLVDDIQFLSESESTQEEFFHTFNALHQSGKQIVLTSDRPPKRLTVLEDRLRSRFEWGLIADIKSPSLETRVAILKKKGEQEHIALDDNILLFVASKLKSNVRELEGFLKRINAYCTITGQPVNMELVKEIMHELLPEEETAEAPAPQYQQHTAPVQPPAYMPPSAPQPTAQSAPPPAPAPAAAPPAAPPPPQVARPPEIKHTAMPDFSQYMVGGSAPKQAPEAKAPAPQHHADDSSLRVIEVAFFFPDGKEKELNTVKEKFKDVIKKHNLKFKLDSVFDRAYNFYAKINFSMFIELCKTNRVTIAIIVGPPPDSIVTSDDFSNNLGILMENEKISMQFLPWADLGKDYRYLNLALDITLIKYNAI